MTEDVLFSTCLINTYENERPLTNASGFLFRRGARLFVVTSGHVFYDKLSEHFPTRISVDFHTSSVDLTRMTGFSIPLYRYGKALWRQALDSAGPVDVAVVEIDQSALPPKATFKAFSPENIPPTVSSIGIGSSLLTIGYPMGFHDHVHHLPVARQSLLASAYGVRFQGLGYFLVDARTHRGLSGAPVVVRMDHGGPTGSELSWYLLGIHSARLESGAREPEVDDILGLNAVWYADVLKTLTN